MRRQKNFLLTLILIIFFWLSLAFQVLFIQPASVKDFIIPGSYLSFFLNLFLALFFTLAVILANSLRGLLFSLAITAFLFLRVWGLGNWFNLILIVAITFSLNRYLYK